MRDSPSSANWASDASERRSIGGGFSCSATNTLRAGVKHNRSLRYPAEFELYALVKAGAEAMGFQFVIRDFGQLWRTGRAQRRQRSLQRQGLERLRHVGCSFLLVQNLHAREGCAACKGAMD